jgi:hypothetical protein
MVLWNPILVSLEMVFVLVQDRSRVCDKRTLCSKIILDTPDGTTRLQGSSGGSFQSVWI